MSDELASYRLQLQQVLNALHADPDSDELLKLKSDLEEIIKIEEDLHAEQQQQQVVAAAAASSSKAGGSKRNEKVDLATRVAIEAAANTKWKVGDRVMAPFSNGQRYVAVIDALITADSVAITFVATGQQTVVMKNQLSVADAEAVVEALNRQHQRHGPKRQELMAERERRKVKAQKKELKRKEKEMAGEQVKNKWQNFNAKAHQKGIKGMKRVENSGSAPDGPSSGVQRKTNELLAAARRTDPHAFGSTSRGNMDSLF